MDKKRREKMDIIIERKRHYIQKRITDYLGKFHVKIIDLRYFGFGESVFDKKVREDFQDPFLK